MTIVLVVTTWAASNAAVAWLLLRRSRRVR